MHFSESQIQGASSRSTIGVQDHPRLQLEASLSAADWILVVGDGDTNPFAGNLSRELLAKVVRYDLNDRMPAKPPWYVSKTSPDCRFSQF